MRYRLMASFQGAPYQAGIGPSDEEVTLFAACPPPEELGFRSSSGHWRKRVSVAEIDALWESRPIGRYRSERCMVLDDLGDRMHIAYLGRDLYMARRLGFWEVDRGVFEVVVPRQEITDLREERGEYELAVLDEGSLPGAWDGGHRETWASNPRDYGYAPDTGPLRSPVASPPRELVDTGPSWAADAPGSQGPRGWDGGGWDGGGWDGRDDQAQDPRDTGTWAAVRDLDPRDRPEADGPFPRDRGGWRARDTGGWERPDTGTWDAREVAELAAREAAANRQATPNPRNTGGWSAREIADTAAREAREARESRNTGSWSAREAAGPAAREPRESRNTGGWSAREAADAAPEPREARASTGSWNSRDVTGPAVNGRANGHWDGQENGRWSAPEADSWDAREGNGWDLRGDGRWDAGQPPQREPDRWDPQDTVSWNPVSSGEWDSPPGAYPPAAQMPAANARGMAEWEPNEVVRPSASGVVSPSGHQRTPDAAVVWHGSPGPEDSGRWGPPVPAADGRGNPPRLAIGSGPADAQLNGPMNGTVNGTVNGPMNGTAPGRHVSRRSSGKTRVTAQTVFSQLLELASIPQSAYAVDDEVDGAMCLVRAGRGYEVFSSADRTRHEVRFFEDEEAAYFYLFGILAAEAVRSGRLGPQAAPPGHRSTSARPGYPSGQR
jgi:hypothetical protein